ncbi:hypothetical protein TNCV_355791, partial [Trichonephila clavipes]
SSRQEIILTSSSSFICSSRISLGDLDGTSMATVQTSHSSFLHDTQDEIAYLQPHNSSGMMYSMLRLKDCNYRAQRASLPVGDFSFMSHLKGWWSDATVMLAPSM